MLILACFACPCPALFYIIVAAPRKPRFPGSLPVVFLSGSASGSYWLETRGREKRRSQSISSLSLICGISTSGCLFDNGYISAMVSDFPVYFLKVQPRRPVGQLICHIPAPTRQPQLLGWSHHLFPLYFHPRAGQIPAINNLQGVSPLPVLALPAPL